LAKHIHSHQYFAIKAISKNDTQLQPIGLAQVMAEREVLAKCSSLFIVKLHSTFQDEKNFYFCLEYMGGGNLRKVLKKYITLELQEARYVAAQTLLGLKYLHEEAMTMHRDLKPENILLTEIGDVKLSDFGLAKIGLAEAFSICGTRQYFAPEQLKQKGYDKKVDFWAFGCLLYELLVGKPPFADKNQARLFERIKCVSSE
jgi:serine/threonine protein kinase